MTHSANRSLIASQSEWVLENNDALSVISNFSNYSFSLSLFYLDFTMQLLRNYNSFVLRYPKRHVEFNQRY